MRARSLRKDTRLDDWAKDVAPSIELRTPYGHDRAKFDKFGRRHSAELPELGRRETLGRLGALATAGPVTLLTATRELDLSQAAVPRQTARPGALASSLAGPYIMGSVTHKIGAGASRLCWPGAQSPGL